MFFLGSAYPLGKFGLNASMNPIFFGALRMGFVFLCLIPFCKISIPKKKYFVPINKAKVLSKGKDITILAMSYLTPESMIAKKYLNKIGIYPEIIDLRSVKPIDFNTIFKSIKKTRNLLVLDTGFKFCSVSSEIISTIMEKNYDILKNAPARLTMPDVPEPTSFALTKNFYINLSKKYCQ